MGKHKRIKYQKIEKENAGRLNIVNLFNKALFGRKETYIRVRIRYIVTGSEQNPF